MNRTRIVFAVIVLGAVCVVIAGLVWPYLQDMGGRTGGQTPTPIPVDTVVLTVSSSNTKQDWVDQMIEAFQATNPRTTSGKAIAVQVSHVGSGSSMNAILDGESKPVVWSPGSEVWVARINQSWEDRTGHRLIVDACPATVRVPLAIAMWKPMAEALGWPDKLIGWGDIADLSTNAEGWASYGHPEWGTFKFGHPHPEHSNSGMLSVVAEVYDAVGKTESLTVEDVTSRRVVENLGAVEKRVFHYGKKDTDILARMTQRGPDYLHAVTSYESNVVKWNRDHADELRFPLVTLYPANGTFWVQNPYCVLEADWVTEEQKQAANIFRNFLLSPEHQDMTIDWGLRPADANVPLHAPIDLEHGAIPDITPDNIPPLEEPSDEVVVRILEVWHQVKKKATVILLLDVSGSMKGEKIKQAVEGARFFVDQMYPDDEIYAVTFSHDITELKASGKVGAVGESLKQHIEGLIAGGGTALHQAVIYALDRMDELKTEHEEAGEPRLYGIVLLSDGKNEIEGGPSESEMLAHLPAGTEASGAKLYTIAYGEDANVDLLKTLANRTNGKWFTGDITNIKDIYFLISSEF